MEFRVGDTVKPSAMLVNSYWPTYQRKGETPGKTRMRMRKWRGRIIGTKEPIGSYKFYVVDWGGANAITTGILAGRPAKPETHNQNAIVLVKRSRGGGKGSERARLRAALKDV